MLNIDFGGSKSLFLGRRHIVASARFYFGLSSGDLVAVINFEKIQAVHENDIRFVSAKILVLLES